jgi:hypothetical protein
MNSAGTATLRIAGGDVVLRPLWPWRKLIRMPELRIPLDEVEAVSKITFGVKFSVPGNPQFDGARFYGYGYQPLDRPELRWIQERGIAVSEMPAPERVRGFFHDFAVSQRPGWIWRDRGWLAFLEFAVLVALGTGFLVATSFFAHLPVFMKVWFGFVVFVMFASALAGHRFRKRVRR